MPTEVRTITDETLIVVSNFLSVPRTQGEPITYTAFSDADSALNRLVPSGRLVLGALLTFLPRSFPFFQLSSQVIYQNGATGLFFNPATFNGTFVLLYQPFANSVGQTWTFTIAPD